MRRVTIAPAYHAWRNAARGLLAAEAEPRALLWEEADDDQPALPGLVEDASGAEGSTARVPRAFLELAEAAACHSDAERWALLYRVLWRLTHGE
ncbi:MAG TPA: hypothetical protein VF613_25195, partial [Longimicrobium sp.]